MTTAKPSPIIVMDIDEGLASSELKLEIGRCYPNVGTVQVRTHKAAEDSEARNTIRLVTLFGMRSYLDASAEGANERWSEVLLKWYRSIIYKLTNHMKIFNRRQREIDETEVYFDELIVELQEGTLEVRYKLDSNSDMPLAEVEKLDLVREFFNKGALGIEVAAVCMPSEASYTVQRERGLAEKAKRDAAAQEATKQERLAKEREILKAEKAAEESFLASPELERQLAQDEGEIDLEQLGYEIEQKFSFPEADFALDYTCWDVVAADGTSKQFDSTTGAFIE